MKQGKVTTLELKQFAEYLKPRPQESHKGDFGHVLIVGGDYGYSGAPLLAAKAALRVGAGLVSVVTRHEHALGLNLSCPEVMCHPDEAIKPLLEKASVIAVGPGLGRSAWARKLLTLVLKTEKPLVVDADALNLLAETHLRNDHWILTPHPGEAARLLKQTTAAVQANRTLTIKTIQEKFGGVCVLKGAGTLVSTPESELSICQMGNPGMATAGMGDVLTGVIAGLLAQRFSLDSAAKCGVVLHAMAGDLAAKEGQRGMIATDLMPYLRQLVN